MDVLNPIPQQDKNWAMFCHLSALSGLLLPIPFANIIAPLILWSMKKDQSSFVNDQGKEALNFQLSMSIIMIVCGLLFFLVLPLIALGLLAILNVVLVIIAGIKANEGVSYRYPFSFRFIY